MAEFGKTSKGLYKTTITTKDGKKKAFCGKTVNIVKQKLAKYYQELALQEEEEENGKLFETVALEWQEKHFKTIEYNTKKTYKKPLECAIAYFGDRYIKDITPKEVNEYIHKFAYPEDAPPYARTTVNIQLAVLSLIFDYACFEYNIPKNPAKFVKLPKGLTKKTRKCPTDEEIEQIINSCNKTHGLFFFFLLFTGMRPGEAYALKWGDIDFKNKTIHVCKSAYYDKGIQIKQPKTESGNRKIPLLEILEEKLLPIRKSENEFVFTHQGKQLCGKTAFELCKAYREETNIFVTPHQMRHGYASLMEAANLSIKQKQYNLGHSNASTTNDIYTHILHSHKTEGSDKLNEYVNKIAAPQPKTKRYKLVLRKKSTVHKQ